MSPNNVRTRGERMREHGGPRFTGRTKETETFEQTIDAIKKQSKKELEKVKTAFDIYGEGGMGKTWLLWEYERICRRKNIVPIYFDIRLWDEPSISTIVDFLKILRKHLGQSVPLQKFLGANPFTNFDQCYARYMGLEELRKRDESKNSPPPTTAERLSKLGAKMALGAGKFIPYINEAAELVGKDNVEEAADIVRESLLNSVQNARTRLQRIFNNNSDVQFYLDHQDELINALVNIISEISEKYYLVILIDSYEEIFTLDVELREKFFSLLPENVVLVLSGRNSIHDNCSPAWREDMHFYVMEEFSNKECEEYLGKRNIKNRELIRAVWDFTEGMPLAVALTADIYDELSGNVKETLKAIKGAGQGKHKDKREWIIEHITERFLNLVPSSERKIIDTCAVLGQMSIDAIEYLLEEKLSDDQIDKLENYSFMRGHDNNFVMHKTVRNFLLNNLLAKKAKYLNSLHLKAAKYSDEQLAKINVKEKFQDENWVHWSLERTYHLIQADSNEAGREEFYKTFSNGLWETEFDFCLQLIEIPAQPVKTARLQGLAQLKKGCSACRSKEYQQAIIHFNELANLKVDSPYFEQMIHDTLGDLYERVQDYSNAIGHYEIALSHFRAFDDLPKIATTQSNLASCLLALEKGHDAIDRLNESLEIRKKSNNLSLLTYPTYLLSVAYQQCDRNQDAVETLKKCCEMYQELGQQENTAYAYYSLGQVYQKLKMHEEALDSLQNALQIQEKLQDKDGLAKTWKEVFLLHKKWEEYPEAIDAVLKCQVIYGELEKQADVANTWNWLGITYREWGKYNDAIDKYQVAFEQFEKLNNKNEIMDVMIGIGRTFLDWEKYPEALDAFEKAKQITHDIEDLQGMTDILAWLGNTYQKYGKHEKAIEQHRSAYKLFEKQDKKSEMAIALLVIGNLYKDWGKYSEAIDAIRKAKKIFEELEKQDIVATLSNQLGIFYREWGKHTEAIEHYQVAFEQFEKLNKNHEMTDVMIGIGRTYLDWKKHPEALGAFENGMKIAQETGNQEDVSGVFLWFGNVHQNSNNYDQSVKDYQQAIHLYQQLNKQIDVAKVFVMIANVYQKWEKYHDAVENLKTAKTIYQELERQKDVASLSNRIAIAYRQWGKYRDALEQYQIAFEQFEKLEDKEETADVMTGIGLTYKEWAKFSEALDAFTKSQQIYQEIDKKEDVANLSDWIGDTYQEWGKYSESLENYQFALGYFAESDAKDRQASVMYDISKTYSNWGRYPESLEIIQSAQEILEKVKGEDAYIPFYLIGVRYQDWGKYAEALKAYEKVLKIMEKEEDEETVLAEVHFSIGKTLYEIGKFDKALSSLEQSLSICERLGLTNRTIYRLRRIGETLAMLERYSDAKDIISRGILIAQNIKNDRSEALCYASMVTISKVTKNIDEARICFALAKHIFTNHDSQLDIAELSQDMGYVEESFGDLNNALGLYEEAVLIYRNFNRLHELAKALRDLGKLQKKIGSDNSIVTLEESATLFISVNRDDEAEITRRLI